MKNCLLLLTLSLYTFQTGFSQIAYHSILSGMNIYDIENSLQKATIANQDGNRLVTYDPIRELIYYSPESIIGVDFLSMPRDGGCVDFALLQNTDLHSPGWFHDFEKQDVYFFGFNGRLSRSNIATDQSETLIADPGVGADFGIDVDLDNEWIYFTERSINAVHRVKLDGSNLEELLRLPSGLSQIGGIALDVVNGKMYFADKGRNMILRADLEGNNLEQLITNLKQPENLDLHVGNNMLVWTSVGDSTLQMADLAGGNLQVLVDTEIEAPGYIHIDQTSGDIYWADNGFNIQKLERINYPAFDRETLVIGFDNYDEIRHDPINQKLYYTHDPGGRIYRSNYDGSQPEYIKYERTFNGRTLATIDGFNEYIYYAVSDNIFRLDMTTGVEEVLVELSDFIRFLEVDISEDRIYWSLDNGNFGYTNLTTLQPTTVSATESVGKFVLDLTSNQVYYHQTAENQIRKMKLDGTGVEPLAFANPLFLAIDVPNDRLYWSEAGNGMTYTDLNGYFPTPFFNQIARQFVVLGAGSVRLPTSEFNATDQNGDAALQWTFNSAFTSSLTGNELFSVEKQVANFRWTEVGTVQAMAAQASYSFMDDNAAFGNNLYRVRYLNSEGQVQFSPALSLDITTDIKEINPVRSADFKSFMNQEMLHVKAAPGLVELFTIEGQEIGRYDLKGTELQIPVGHLANGSYVIRYISAEDNSSGAKVFVIAGNK